MDMRTRVTTTISSGFRRWVARDRRFGLALLGSALLHALMLLSLANYSVQSRAFTRPLVAPLSVRLERLSESVAEKSIAIDKQKPVLRIKAFASMPVAPIPSVEVEPAPPEPGVSLFETAYLKPIASRVSSPLLTGGEFRRAAEISEMAAMLRMSVPKYPREAQEQNLSGWVTVMFFVDERGKVIETAAVDASESFGSFEKDIATQMRDSTFAPGKLDGRPVKTLVFATARFDAAAWSAAPDRSVSNAGSSGDR
jgi:outer membrane biosynthesis protein TonB